jgi:hypothetical protein
MTTGASSSETPHLRRELRLWEAVGISLALMAPSMAANINPQGTWSAFQLFGSLLSML